MSKDLCRWVGTVKEVKLVNGTPTETEKTSLLWLDIAKFTGNNRELTKNIYFLLKTNFVRDYFDAEFDLYGEVIFSSVRDKYDFSKFLKDDAHLKEKMRLYNLIDEDGNVKSCKNVLLAIQQANSFNEDVKDHRAIPTMDSNGNVTCSVRRAGTGLDYAKLSLKFTSNLNENIIRFLNQLGFQISFVDFEDKNFNGLFMPEGSRLLVDGLMEVIQVANNEKGAAAIPEEFAHLLILGLYHTPLVLKMMNNLLSPYDLEHRAIQAILGDTFETYKSTYMKGLSVDWLMMAKEAAGKLLAKSLKGESLYDGKYKSFQEENYAPTNLILRIVNFICKIFKNVGKDYINNLVIDALKRADFVSHLFVNNKLNLFNEIKTKGVKDILNSDTMYDVNEGLSYIENLAKQGKHLVDYAYKRDYEKALYEGDLSVIPGLDSQSILRAKDLYADWLEDKRDLKKFEEYRDLILLFMEARWDTKQRIGAESSDGSTTMADHLILISEAMSDALIALKNSIDEKESEFEERGSRSTVEQMRDLALILNYIKKVNASFDNFNTLVNAIKKTEEYKNPLSDNPLINTPGNIKKLRDRLDDIIKSVSGNISLIGVDLKRQYNDLSEKLLVTMVKLYLPNGYEVLDDYGNRTRVDAEDIVKIANSDLSVLDMFTKGMYQCSDYLLNILNNIFVDLLNIQRLSMVALELGIRSLQAELEQAGYNTKFMFEVDLDGNKTGRYISNYNFDKWLKDLEDYYQSLKANGTGGVSIRTAMREWHLEHSMLVDPSDPNSLVPNLNYKENGVEVYNTHKLELLSSALRKYYDLFIQFKNVIDSKYPKGTTHLYSCILITRSGDEKLISAFKDPSIKQTWLDITDEFSEMYTVKDDDADYITGQRVHLDIDGNIIRSVPVKYTGTLLSILNMSQERKNLLTEDCSSALLAYTAAGSNYQVCHDLINQFLVAEDYIREVRTVPNDLSYFINLLGKKELFTNNKSINAANRLDVWIKANMEGNRKQLEEWRIGNFVINFGAVGDWLRGYTTKFRLSMNPVTGVMNLVDEEIQAFIETSEGEFFNKKEYAEAETECMTMGIDHLMLNFDVNPDDMLGLLRKTFDFTDDYIDGLREGNIKNGTMERILGENYTHLFMHLGELHNHVIPGVAHLKHIKVTINGEPASLYDCLEKIKYKVGDGYAYRLLPKDGVKVRVESNRYEGGFKEFDFTRKFSEADLEEMDRHDNRLLDEYLKEVDQYFGVVSNSIKTVNRRMNGAMGSVDSGVILQYVIGRCAMQFRGWLVAYLTNRFGNDFLDSEGEVRQAYWNYVGRFAFNQMKYFILKSTDLLKQNEGFRRIEYKNLDPKQKGYIKRALAEVGLFCVGLLASAYLGGDFDWDDDDDKKKKKKRPYSGTEWESIGRFLYMLTIRGTLEMGASVPTLSTIDSFVKIFEDPIPCLDNLLQMLNFVTPSYIVRHLNKDAKTPRFGITNDYFLKLLSYCVPQSRLVWNTYDLLFTDKEDPFRWFETND